MSFRVPPRDPQPSTFTIFRQSSPPGIALPSSGSGRWNPSDIDEPSVSNNGSAVFYTGNWYAAESPNSGLSWSYIDPFTAFPGADNGFCCDQNTIYDPVNNITIWQLLYLPVQSGSTAGDNRVRLAVANGQAGVTGNVWHIFDVTTASVGAATGSWLDYPQLGISQNNLFLTVNNFQGPPGDRGCYVSVTQCVQLNSYAIRLPLASLAATAAFPIQYFSSPCTTFCLDTLTPVQQVGNIMYFGAHGGTTNPPDTTILRILEWPDSSSQPTVSHDVPDSGFTYMVGADGACAGAGGFNTCARDDSRVRAGWLKNGEVAFAWDARQDGAFPYPYIRAARVNLSTFTVIGDFTVAFQTAAAVYPGIAANNLGGLALTFTEAGGVDASPKADIAISDTLNPVWELRSLASGSGPNQGNYWGDYLTIRPASGTGNSWVATGYTVQGAGVQPIFAWFGRQRDDPFRAQGLTCVSIASAMGAQTNQAVANFVAPSGSLSDYSATIDWEDGTRTTTVPASGTPTAATVMATHAFTSAGTLSVTVTVTDSSGGTATCTASAVITGSVYTMASTSQYQLSDSDGTTWQTIDATHLVLKITPSADSTAVISANADLWTQDAGINQDIGIAVSGGTGLGTTYPTMAGQPEAWKESGGFAGTFSPNAAYLQTAIALKAGQAYTITPVWKANKPAAGKTIMAGAGPLSPPLPVGYSPVRVTAHVIAGLPAANPNFAGKSIKTQPVLQNSNGSTWQDMTGLSQSFTAPSDGTLVIGGNADLWTANAGYNQDLGITLSGGTGAGTTYPSVAGQPEAWKESGGYGGTLSPNAAFVQAVIPVKNAATYLAKLQWKTNRPSGATIVAGAGPIGSTYSPTTLTMQFFAATNVSNAAIMGQPGNASSDGATFLPMDAGGALSSTIPPSTTNNCVAIVGGNADLWTANAGYNQDIAIWVDGNLVGWKESGGFAGTFSPNAAFVQSVIAVPMNTSPGLTLQWKTNIDARPSGARIFAGAGPIGGRYSPTRLSAEIICS